MTREKTDLILRSFAAIGQELRDSADIIAMDLRQRMLTSPATEDIGARFMAAIETYPFIEAIHTAGERRMRMNPVEAGKIGAFLASEPDFFGSSLYLSFSLPPSNELQRTSEVPQRNHPADVVDYVKNCAGTLGDDDPTFLLCDFVNSHAKLRAKLYEMAKPMLEFRTEVRQTVNAMEVPLIDDLGTIRDYLKRSEDSFPSASETLSIVQTAFNFWADTLARALMRPNSAMSGDEVLQLKGSETLLEAVSERIKEGTAATPSWPKPSQDERLAFSRLTDVATAISNNTATRFTKIVPKPRSLRPDDVDRTDGKGPSLE